MNKEQLQNFFLNALVIFSIVLAVFIKHYNNIKTEPKPYGEIRTSEQQNEILASIHIEPGEAFYFIEAQSN